MVAMAVARVRAASTNPVDRTEALTRLHQIVTAAQKGGFIPEEFHARLALAEVEIAVGDAVQGRAHLEALEKDADQKGWQSIVHKTAAHLKPAPSPSRPS